MSQISSFSSHTQSASPPQVQLASTTPELPWLIVGLGTPGKKYEYTRHNIGFEMVDLLAEAEAISMNTVTNFNALFGKGIRPRRPQKMDTANYILGHFSKQEHGQLDNIFRIGLKGIRMLLFEGVSDSGTFVNTPKDYGVSSKGERLFHHIGKTAGRLIHITP